MARNHRFAPDGRVRRRLIALLLLAAGSHLTGAALLVRGTVQGEDPDLLRRLTVEIHSLGSNVALARAALSADGGFEAAVPDGQRGGLEIRVLNALGDVVQREFLRDASQSVVIRLESSIGLSPVGGVIPAAELRRPSRRYRREMRRAGRAGEKGDVAEAVRGLSRAVEMEPERASARVALGSALLRLQRYEEAREAFACAAALDGRSEPALTGLAMSLHGLGSLGRAERHARKAVEIEPTSLRAHYVLGSVLAAKGAVAQALVHLEHAADKFPAALLTTSRVLLGRGDHEEALSALSRCAEAAGVETKTGAECRDLLRRMEVDLRKGRNER